MSHSSTSNKERHYAHLQGRLAQLANNISVTEQNVRVAAEQASYLRRLGVHQAAQFMAVLHSIDQENAQADAEAEAREAAQGTGVK